MSQPDYYHILGLVPDAEDAVIRAAYRALMAIYHPDRNSDENAAEKAQQINAAYDVLSDPVKRKQYDESRAEDSHNASSDEFENDQPFSTSPIDKPWAVACEFYPRIDAISKDLEKLSWRISFAFKLLLLERKRFDDAKEIANKLKGEYLSRYFGSDKEIQAYAEHLIKSGHKEAALYLNEIVNVMGRSVSSFSIKHQVEKRYEGVSKVVESRHYYGKIKYGDGLFNSNMAHALVRLHGGTVKDRFFSARVDVELDGESMSFEDGHAFCKFVLERFRAYA
ncbi:hypothetical protein FHR99_003234 [Litorivivens lipolytica]|uniref:J domain-containing protein n=1 Tax=Litorivivens lipolytica TaxID=1524264 RepID=A0A7W4W7Z1_9GAMM|nr:DnaJ domain-containing protein [Litorivivens lipolytica]MBB3048960.1 hypothetical protein [Litorivivens lipolytica]